MSENSTGWGGARAGAGRKRLSDEPLANYNIRMPKDLIATCKSNGGAKYIRKAVQHYIDFEAKKAELSMAPVARADNNVAPSMETFTEVPDVTTPEVEMHASCGFPSPALDFAEERFDVTKFFMHNAKHTFVVTASGDSMINAGIVEGDKLFIDQSIEPRSGMIVLAYVDGGLTVKTLRIVNGLPELHPENPAYPVIRPECLEDFRIQGVVVSIGRQLVR